MPNRGIAFLGLASEEAIRSAGSARDDAIGVAERLAAAETLRKSRLFMFAILSREVFRWHASTR
jgi:hypothetical protein